MIPGIIPMVAGGDRNPSFEVGGTGVVTTSATTHTFSGVSAVSPRPGRRLLAVISGRSGASAAINNVLIGGVAATNIASLNVSNDGGYHQVGFFVVQNDASTSVDISVTYASASARSGVTLFSLYDFLDFITPTESKNNSGLTTTASITSLVKKDGAIFAASMTKTSAANSHRSSVAADLFNNEQTVSYSLSVAAGAVTWTNLTKRSDLLLASTATGSTSYSYLAIALR